MTWPTYGAPGVGGFATEAEAQAELDKVKAKITRGVSVAEVITGLYLEEWLAAKGDIRPATRRSYAGHITNYLIPHLGHYRLDELRTEPVAEIGASDATRQRVRATLRSARADAVRQGLVTVNVAALVKLPGGKRPPGAGVDRSSGRRAGARRWPRSSPRARRRPRLGSWRRGHRR